VWSVKVQPTFRENMSPPSSRSKPRKKPAWRRLTFNGMHGIVSEQIEVFECKILNGAHTALPAKEI
jgi:hypothetical protein